MLGGALRRLRGPLREFGESPREMGGNQRQLEGPQRELGEHSREFGEPPRGLEGFSSDWEGLREKYYLGHKKHSSVFFKQISCFFHENLKNCMSFVERIKLSN